MQPVTRSLSHWSPIPGVVFRERAYAPDGVIERHSHAHTTLILVVEGSFEEEYEGRAYLRSPGALHILPGGLQHATTVHRTGARVFLVGLYREWLHVSSDRRIAVARPVSQPSGGRPAALGRRMYEEFQARDAAAGLSLEGLLLETLGILIRVQTRAPLREVPPWLATVRDRLHEEFARPPAISQLADDAGVSPGYLYRAFRARFHCTPGDCVRRARVEYVKRALCASREPISHIAYSAGFGDQAHMTRCFRGLVGVTPGAYRKLHAPPEVSS